MKFDGSFLCEVGCITGRGMESVAEYHGVDSSRRANADTKTNKLFCPPDKSEGKMYIISKSIGT